MLVVWLVLVLCLHVQAKTELLLQFTTMVCMASIACVACAQKHLSNNSTATVSADRSLSVCLTAVTASYVLPYPGQSCFGRLAFTFKGSAMQVLPVWKTLQIQSCSLGQVTDNTNDTCRVCGAATFSLNPQNTSCDTCPSGILCYGSAIFIPPLHYWHSSPNSTTILSCPNTAGCGGNRTQLLACKQVSPEYSAMRLAFS